jgi:hypothetical protein
MKILNSKKPYVGFLLVLLFQWGAISSVAASEPQQVDVFNFARAHTAFYMERLLSDGRGINNWRHSRSLVEIGDGPQRGRRLNRDTLYSSAIVDISKGAVLTIPKTQGRALFNEWRHHGVGSSELNPAGSSK